jgi:hypothetical protein
VIWLLEWIEHSGLGWMAGILHVARYHMNGVRGQKQQGHNQPCVLQCSLQMPQAMPVHCGRIDLCFGSVVCFFSLVTSSIYFFSILDNMKILHLIGFCHPRINDNVCSLFGVLLLMCLWLGSLLPNQLRQKYQ